MIPKGMKKVIRAESKRLGIQVHVQEPEQGTGARILVPKDKCKVISI